MAFSQGASRGYTVFNVFLTRAVDSMTLSSSPDAAMSLPAGPTRCVLIMPRHGPLPPALRDAIEASGWQVVPTDDIESAMAELLILERAERARCAWGLARAERLAVLASEPLAENELQSLEGSIIRWAPHAELWTWTGEAFIGRVRSLPTTAAPPRSSTDLAQSTAKPGTNATVADTPQLRLVGFHDDETEPSSGDGCSALEVTSLHGSTQPDSTPSASAANRASSSQRSTPVDALRFPLATKCPAARIDDSSHDAPAQSTLTAKTEPLNAVSDIHEESPLPGAYHSSSSTSSTPQPSNPPTANTQAASTPPAITRDELNMLLADDTDQQP